VFLTEAKPYQVRCADLFIAVLCIPAAASLAPSRLPVYAVLKYRDHRASFFGELLCLCVHAVVTHQGGGCRAAGAHSRGAQATSTPQMTISFLNPNRRFGT